MGTMGCAGALLHELDPPLRPAPFSGIVGFGAQILGMRVGLGLGLNYNRIVVGNPGHEASMVQSELKWRRASLQFFVC
jgi:hypothetical protein